MGHTSRRCNVEQTSNLLVTKFWKSLTAPSAAWTRVLCWRGIKLMYDTEQQSSHTLVFKMTRYLENRDQNKGSYAQYLLIITLNIENMSAFPKVIYTLNEIPVKFSYDFCGYWQDACQMHIRMRNTKISKSVLKKEKKKNLSGLYNHKLRSALKSYNKDVW